MERTLIIFKPDAVQRGLCGEILTRFEKKGFEIVGLKSPDTPAYMTRSVRPSVWRSSGPVSPTLASSK